jgi:hypothetical protein
MLVKHLGTYKTRDGRIVKAINDEKISNLYLLDNNTYVGCVWVYTGCRYTNSQEDDLDIIEEILPGEQPLLPYTIKLTYDLKLSKEDYEKYEPIGEYRKANKGEFYFNGDKIVQWSYDKTQGRYVIFKEKVKPYQWPMINDKPLAGWGFAKDKNGATYLYDKRPTKNRDVWLSGGSGLCTNCSKLIRLNIPVPEITDWEKPVLNPYYKQE